MHWLNEAACAAYASQLATRLATHSVTQASLPDAFITLHGPLGAGKTTFVRYLLRALGIDGRIKSPSYAVLEPYELAGWPISHFDFYRFADPREWLDAGFREVFEAPGLKLVEWPEKAAGMLPVADLDLSIELLAGNQRRVWLQARTPRGLGLMQP